MSRMWFAWISENSNGFAIRPWRAASVSSDAADQGDDLVDHVERADEALDDVRAVRALRSRYSDRRVMTSIWWFT